jgi:hypothetical protein
MHDEPSDEDFDIAAIIDDCEEEVEDLLDIGNLLPNFVPEDDTESLYSNLQTR